jgi:hypothetical protein
MQSAQSERRAVIRLLSSATLAGLIALSTFAFAQTPTSAPTGTLQARISDSMGAAISRAFVLVHGEGSEKASQPLSVNDNGEFQVQLAPGLYDLFIGSTGFVPYAKEVRVVPGKPTILKIKMAVDLANITMTSRAGN